MNEVIKFNNVTFGYDGNTILEDINFSVNEGDYIGIIGQNGAGKSTLLKLMINEINPIEGNIQIEGQDIKNFRQWESIGYVNQKSNSFSSSKASKSYSSASSSPTWSTLPTKVYPDALPQC